MLLGIIVVCLGESANNLVPEQSYHMTKDFTRGSSSHEPYHNLRDRRTKQGNVL